ncbi:hypothetical protein [Bacillus piscicola]|uniref:hypothetical protein n=1 Tax=Bacillus piscicola TaxID=1632684 RepID=UPI001F09D016|nr:hypothetical protein [Bacillus piscicola]
MKNPMLWTFIWITVFVLLFFMGTVQLEGVQSAAFQMVGFGGMIFAMLYGLLITQHSEEKEREKEK